MRFHWYWPFARSEELAWARATVREHEQVVIQVIDRPAAPDVRVEDHLVVMRDLPDVARDVAGPRWAISRVGTYRDRVRARRALWSALDFDLVHLHYINRFTDAIAHLPHPMVMSVHDVLPHRRRLAPAVERRLLQRVYARPDLLVVHHRWIADRLMRDLRVQHQRIEVLPHQVFPVDGHPSAPPAGRPTVLMFGALRPNKGLEVLAAALNDLAGEDISVVIAGRGDRAVEEVALRLAARDERVRVELGFVTLERKRELFRTATVVVLPYTDFESQSGVLHDAYGHGRPVVATDVGALGPTVRADGTGVVVQPGDPRSLAAGIRLALRPLEWRQLADAANAVARERTPEATGRQLRDLYDLVLR